MSGLGAIGSTGAAHRATVDASRALRFQQLLADAGVDPAALPPRRNPDYRLLISTLEELRGTTAVESYLRAGRGPRTGAATPQREADPSWGHRPLPGEVLGALIRHMGGAPQSVGKGAHVDLRV